MFAGCVQESIDSFESIKLDKTYLTIPEAGGEVELTITATQDWNFVETEMWPRVIAYQKDSNGKEIKDADGNKVIDEEKTTSSWLTLQGEMTGTAGETKVVFSADPTNGGRELELSIKAGNNVQYFRVRQGTMVASDATCADVIAGVDGKSYRVQGVCTSIANDYYGNFYLNDGTGEIYVYGTKDGDGQYNWDDFNIEVGDSVKVEGPRKDYNGTIELVDALFIKVIKSLIKLVEPTNKMVDREGETFDVKLAYKGKGVFYTVADECSSWVKIEGMTSKSGEPTKLEPNPADTAIVTVTVAPFEELSSREGSIEFSSSLDDAKSVITFAFRQGVEAKTAAEFNAMEKGSVPYKVTGCVREITNTKYGNMYVADHTGSVYVYGTLDADGNTENFSSLGIEVGDIVSVVSPVDVYKDAAQMKNATVAEKIDVEAKTVEAFLATEEDKTYYRLTGTVSGIADGDIYGNMTITDETGSVYVYGLLSGYGGEKKLFQDLVADTNLSNGDKLTLVGYHTSHKGNPQVGGAFYLLHEEGSEGGEEPAEPKVVTVKQFKEAAEDATVYQLTGTVKEITNAYSADYGNISFDLEDETGFVNIFRMSCKGIEDPTAISVGDEITVQGTRSSHEGNIQMAKGGKCIKFTDKDGAEEPEVPVYTHVTIAEFNDLADNATAEITGTVTGIYQAYSSQYGNISVYLKDDTAETLVFRMSCEGIDDPTKIAEGDKITVQGTKTTFAQTGAAQMAQGGKVISYIPFESVASDITLAGDFNNWSKDATPFMTVGYSNDIVLIKNLEIASGQFKVVKGGESWCGYAEAGKSGYANQYYAFGNGTGENFGLVEYGTFDVYFDKANSRIALMTPGKPYEDAVAGTAITIIKDLDKHTWSVAGSFAGIDCWGANNLTMVVENGYAVAKNATITNGDEFKFRADNDWAISYGAGCDVNVGNKYTTYSGGGNMKFVGETGSYNLYFSLLDASFYMEKAAEGGEESKESVTLNVKMSDLVAANGYTVSSGNTVTNYKNLTLDSVISMVAGGTGSNEGSFWSEGKEWRLYQSGGGKVTVSAASGYTIQSVKFTYTVSKTGILKKGSDEVESGSTDTVNSSSVTYTVGNTTSTVSNGQVRITDVEVIYVAN